MEIRDAAQADANAKSAISEALYTSLTTNEQAILLEVRRFAPSAFDIPTADQVLRNAGQRRRALAEAQSAAREAAPAGICWRRRISRKKPDRKWKSLSAAGCGRGPAE